ncbi:MAG: TatD family hydrolase [Candidatus Pacebacteria bacterium]|nr:TatD family hydrolase [Candidatus Paceibacterota bacterium]MBP9840026.1 TatD family hydrolase [Candidatus Paceibacterota bacterium]
MRYFDAHCHIQFDKYADDRDAIITRMREEGIGGLVVGVDKESSESALDLVHDSETLWATAGHHPNDTPLEQFDEAATRALLASPKVVAVGECGIDYFRPEDANAEVKRSQRELFERHIGLSVEYGKPLMIHGRPSKGSMDAYHDLLSILESGKQEHGDKLRGNVHFFVGDTDIARRVFALDFTVSYTAVLTFARDYDEAVRFAPLDRLLTETDAPYVAPKSRRGQRNDPLSIPEIVTALAEIRGEDRETVREAVLRNAIRAFKVETAS